MKRVIIDTDPGIDDTAAIFLALASPELHIEALTTVYGNGTIADCTRNALLVLETAGRSDIPVYQGAGKPLMEAPTYGSYVHGGDALGDVGVPCPVVGAPQARHYGGPSPPLKPSPGGRGNRRHGYKGHGNDPMGTRSREVYMHPGDLNLTTQVTGHGRFLFVRLPQVAAHTGLALALDRLGTGMENMYDVEGSPSAEALQRGRLQFLRAEPALSRACDIPHPQMFEAHFLVYLEAAGLAPLVGYEEALRTLIEPQGGVVETLAGVQRPRSYTSYAMTQFAYAPAFTPRSGGQCPLGVVMPQNKTAAWWAMDWMHRESFFLPRYDAQENLIAEGHARAAAVGIPCITRRLVHAPDGYGRAGQYDFIGYFEFADMHAPTFRAVMAALRDVAQNPEWAYVQEGPEWWGRRVRNAGALWE